jgi:hypothetical protein
MGGYGTGGNISTGYPGTTLTEHPKPVWKMGHLHIKLWVDPFESSGGPIMRELCPPRATLVTEPVEIFLLVPEFAPSNQDYWVNLKKSGYLR